MLNTSWLSSCHIIEMLNHVILLVVRVRKLLNCIEVFKPVTQCEMTSQNVDPSASRASKEMSSSSNIAVDGHAVTKRLQQDLMTLMVWAIDEATYARISCISLC